MPQLHVFALQSDWALVFERLERVRHLSYFRMGPGPTQQRPEILSGTAIPNLGQADGDQHVACEEYLVAERPYRLTTRLVAANDGVTRYYVDQMANPDTITVCPAGLWAEGVAIMGRVATLYDSPLAKSLMSAFRSAIKKDFTRFSACWVGPTAGALLAAGGRLCNAVQSPAEYDLRPKT